MGELLDKYNEQRTEIANLRAKNGKLITLKKMCQAIVKYNENRHIDSEQFLVRGDMFRIIKHTLKHI